MGHRLLRDRLADLLHLVRWRDWADSKLPTYLVAVFYALGRDGPPDGAGLARGLALVLVLCLYAAFGHIVNDYSDRAADRAAGKRRLIATFEEGAARAAAAGPAVVAALVALAVFGPATALLLAASIGVAAAYSLRPVRLKERGLAGWAAATAAQRTLPLAIVFQALGVWDWATLLLIVHGTLVGVRFIALHQLLDRANDRRAGIRTMATTQGSRSAERLVQAWIFPAELATGALALLAMAVTTPIVLLAPIAYGGFLLVARDRGQRFRALSYGVLYEFYAVAWPGALALGLAVANPLFLPALIATLWLVASRATTTATFQLTPRPPPAEPPGVAGDSGPDWVAMQSAEPLVRRAWPGLGPIWLVTRHDLAVALAADRRFVDADATAPGSRSDERVARALAGLWTPAMLNLLERKVERLAGTLLDRARAAGGLDLVADYATAVPIAIRADLLGLPPANVGRFRDLLRALAGHGRGEWSASAQLDHGLAPMPAARRRDPRGDLATALVQAGLGDAECVAALRRLLHGWAGSANLVGNGALALLRHPGQFHRLGQNPALAAAAVEEVLRHDGPYTLSPPRRAALDTAVAGHRIARGTAIRLLLPAVNRDPAAFTDPDRFDIGRSPCPHLALSGVEPLAPLIRLEGRIMLRLLAEHLPDLRLDPQAEPQWLTHPIQHGLRRLPLRIG